MLRLLLMLAALAGPHLQTSSVHVVVPRPYELWDGRVRGTVEPGASGTAQAFGVAATGAILSALRT